MVVSCIIGVARREITPLYQTGVAFERYETGVFLQKLWKDSHNKNMMKARDRK